MALWAAGSVYSALLYNQWEFLPFCILMNNPLEFCCDILQPHLFLFLQFHLIKEAI